MIENFTPWSALAGGALIGLSSLGVFALFGRVAGISGIVGNLMNGNLMSGSLDDLDWRIGFVAGLVIAPLIYVFVTGVTLPFSSAASTWVLILAGLLVGFGSRLGNGCTSGHGICGISRLSIRSMISVGVFMATAVVLNLVF